MGTIRIGNRDYAAEVLAVDETKVNAGVDIAGSDHDGKDEIIIADRAGHRFVVYGAELPKVDKDSTLTIDGISGRVTAVAKDPTSTQRSTMAGIFLAAGGVAAVGTGAALRAITS